MSRFTPSEASRSLNLPHFLITLTSNSFTGYSNIAELWMTDLCMEPEAESSCEAAVLKACENDENKWPDGSQALSSLRLSQRRGGDASEAILKAYAMIEKGCVASANTVGLGSKDVRENAAMEDGQALEIEEEELKRVEELPGFEFRTQTSKLMLECAGVEGLGKEEVRARSEATS
ncbi:hypothetical protein TL16_g06173 [Triparma laevis f. inornata]|uniref:Uncharacterized protein n=1 Tax=Triparma laevis f. inornata TaxID=1714386 RepID=A0A9W7AIB9_9STRA|nr:hypothetical protein TL16_g06173 [Triparma laevis f. inornata]